MGLKRSLIVLTSGCLLTTFMDWQLLAAETPASSIQYTAEVVLDENVTEPELHAKPTSCVALHRGQVCYQSIEFSWQNESEELYCLFNARQDNPLYCSYFQDSRFVYQYASKSAEVFYLRQGKLEGPVVASVTVHTSWVYRTGRRSSSGWRLF